jgi:hypothetical protein
MHARAVVTAALLSFAAPGTARAAITYVDIPDARFLWSSTVVDLNSDGRDDLLLDEEGGWTGPTGFEYHWYRSYAVGLNGSHIAPTRPAAGELIGAGSYAEHVFTTGWEHQHGPGGYPDRWFPWSPTDGQPVFLALRLQFADGTQHYGWARYQMRNFSGHQHETYLIDCAFETDPGVPITAGAIPTPGVLTLPACAAAFLAITRRRARTEPAIPC